MWKETMTHEIWEAFEKPYVDKSIANKIFLTKNFFMLQMNHNNTMEQHVNKLGAMAEELDAIGTTILDEINVMVFLMNLSERYQNFIIVLESFKPKDRTWDNVSMNT